MEARVLFPPPGFDDLSVDEQLDYVQSLWDRLAARSDRWAVPEWHQEELRRREREAEREDGSPWHDVRERIARRGRAST
jgi:putative addiction module component (TIGR02574 family)